MKLNKLLRLLLGQYLTFRIADGEEGGGAAPAGDSSSSVDWGDMNSDVDPGADDEDSDESEDEDKDEEEETPDETTTVDDSSTEDPPADGEEGEETDPSKEATPEEESQENLTPEQLAAQEAKVQEDFNKWRQAEIERISSETYQFDEETAARLQTEPELVLPKLAAELELNATKRALEAVQRMLPQLVPQVVERGTTEKAATDAFYGANPDLKKYHKQVMIAGRTFRQLNPKATPQEAIEKIGAMVRASLGLKPVGSSPAGSKPAKPAKPHKPAMPGTSSGSRPAAAKGGDVWGDLIDDD